MYVMVHCKLKPSHFVMSTRLLCTKPLSINPGMMVYTIRTTDGCAGASGSMRDKSSFEAGWGH